MAKLGFVLVLILLILDSAFTPAVAAPGEVRWSQANIPAEGEVGGWLLAAGSDVKHLNLATTGTLYAYADGLNLLLESTDGGSSWTETGYSGGDVVDIATSSREADVLYVTDGSRVFRSADGGASFSLLAEASLQAALTALGGTQVITTIAAGYDGAGNAIILVGTDDTTAGTCNGDVLFAVEGQYPVAWVSLGLDGGYDVISVSISPDFATSSKIIALVTNDDPETLILSNEGIIGNWDVVAELLEDNTTSFEVTAASDISFPADYADTQVLFVGVVGDTTGGDVYMVYDVQAAIDLNIGSGYGLSSVNVASLTVSGSAGDAYLLAGAAASSQVYRSFDGGVSWIISVKEPSGQSGTCVLMAPDFASSGKAYASTSGIESAVSRTLDGGATWNQLSLIDTSIGTIVDLALPPGDSQAGTLFMLTWGGEFSLWRSLDGGTRWERVFSSAPAYVDSIDMVGLSPWYGNGSQVLFIAGSGDGSPAIWRSADSGQSFSRRRAPLSVDQWAVAGDATLFIAGYDGSSGLVYRTDNGGLSYSTGAAIGSQSLSSIALSPGYSQDGTILVGNSNGGIYWSNDNGASFEPLPPGAGPPPLSGNISVAFALRFSSNRIVYAASDTPDAGIYRFVIGTATGWQSIDSTLPAGGMIYRLVVSADGTLYAANFQQVDTVNGKGGVERCLEPASSPGATFETVTRGLDDGTTLWGLWLNGNRLWSIDSTNNRLMTYVDSLSRPVVLSSPADRAAGIGTVIGSTVSDVSLFWQPLGGATGYWWQLDDDNDFSSVPPGFEGNTSSISVGLPVLSTATTYYWRVRAMGPVLSPWSEKWSFTTLPGASVAPPANLVPPNGAVSVPIMGLAFAWSPPAGGATSYNFELTTDPTFATITEGSVNVAVPYLVWEPALQNETTYYWRVRSVTAAGESLWVRSVFTTVVALPDLEVPPPPTPTITLKIPDIEWPEIPDLEDFILDITIPPPDITLPDITLPLVEIPDITLPEVVLPDIILPEVVLPDIVLPTPQVTVVPPVVTQTTVPALVINVEEVAPAYIWAIVVIGGVLVIAVIVLIVRTRRIV